MHPLKHKPRSCSQLVRKLGCLFGPPSAGILLPGGVQVGSGVPEAQAAFVATLATIYRNIATGNDDRGLEMSDLQPEELELRSPLNVLFNQKVGSPVDVGIGEKKEQKEQYD